MTEQSRAEYHRKWRAANPGYDAKWRDKNRDQVRQVQQAWNDANRDRRKAANARYKAKKKAELNEQ